MVIAALVFVVMVIVKLFVSEYTSMWLSWLQYVHQRIPDYHNVMASVWGLTCQFVVGS